MSNFSNLPLKFKVMTLFNFVIGVVMVQQSATLALNSFKESPLVIVFTILCFIATIVALNKDYLKNNVKKILSFLPLIIIIFYFLFLLIISR